ncbi:MAG TPA: XdhC/CoxI family protein, partial [Opitutus sp.]|nr:XdhC/CoxI family protein [Opitutus sp.]
VLATLVTVAGSSYRRPGARLLITSGARVGSISGGCLEQDVVARAHRVRTTGEAELVTYDTTSENDLVWGVGLGCHGVVQVLLEKIPAPPPWAAALAANQIAGLPTELAVTWRSPDPARIGTGLARDRSPAEGEGVFHNVIAPPFPLFVFGAGDDAVPLVNMARELGWQVTVADPRAEFASSSRFPLAHAVVSGRSDELVAHTDPPAHAAAVVMTHHYVHDLPILRALLQRDLVYLGLLGPKARATRILADLDASGTAPSAERRKRLHAPVGLDLGAETPAEVALSIVAEIQARIAGRDAKPLRERNRPIHG